jgi:hypothetical protein
MLERDLFFGDAFGVGLRLRLGVYEADGLSDDTGHVAALAWRYFLTADAQVAFNQDQAALGGIAGHGFT